MGRVGESALRRLVFFGLKPAGEVESQLASWMTSMAAHPVIDQRIE
jgi:hypothetical protein